ncbi:hypothetical protein ColTof3_10423 [Colletotrichum tofieldiae]|nr:hypothetical protein ColTof3_10423 [Colletotrichum tofieldiae]
MESHHETDHSSTSDSEDPALDEIEVAASPGDQTSLPTQQAAEDDDEAPVSTADRVRWDPVSTKRFLQLCVEARTAGLIGLSNKTVVLERAMGTIVPTLQREFPDNPYSIKNLTVKYRNLSSIFRKVKVNYSLFGGGGLLNDSEILTKLGHLPDSQYQLANQLYLYPKPPQ